MAFPPTCLPLARALDERGYTEPTPVQVAVLGHEAEERDLLVSAQTGSGKTIAYGLAIGSTILGDAEFLGRAGEPVALIVLPTRELALQVHGELGLLYRHAGARIVFCVGGMDARREQRQLSDGAHIIVGTPGRLRDHLERGALKVSGLKALVLDEADEMLDLGFREDLEFILKTTPSERRTLLFSATLPKSVIALAKHYQNDAFRIQVSGGRQGHSDIEYRAMRVSYNDVEHAVVNVLRFVESPSALVFCNTRESVRHLHAILLERGFSAVALSGELSQSERNHALQALRDGRARVCVATDVAARGIDLPSLGLVIHADLPNDAEVLQHRSGRTGRAGRKGVSVLLIPPSRRRRAEQLLSSAPIQPIWSGVPTAEEIRQLDHERLLQNPLFTEPASEDDTAMARALLAIRSAEEIAIAFSRLYRAQLPAPEDMTDPGSQRPRREPRERNAKDEPRERQERGTHNHGSHERAPYNREPKKMRWFRLDVGRAKNADPKWLVPMICRRGKITKQDIGSIRILDDETKFEIGEDVAEKFAREIRHAKSGDGIIEPLGDTPGDILAHGPKRRPRPSNGATQHPRAPARTREGTAPRKPWTKNPDSKPRQEGKSRYENKPTGEGKPRYDAGSEKPKHGGKKNVSGQKFGVSKFAGKQKGRPTGAYKGKKRS